MQLVVRELLAYQGDIVCLQEVDSQAYKGLLRPFLSNQGYSVSHFTQKDTAMNMAVLPSLKMRAYEVLLHIDLALGNSMDQLGHLKEAFEVYPHARDILVGYLGMIGQITVLRSRRENRAKKQYEADLDEEEKTNSCSLRRHADSTMELTSRLLQTDTIARCLSDLVAYCSAQASNQDCAGSLREISVSRSHGDAAS